VLVDETFREFGGHRSFLGMGHPRLWATGSFTKFFAADDLRVGFVVAPEGVTTEFARFHGLVTNQLAPYSVAGATQALRNREKIRRTVFGVLRANSSALRKAFPDTRSLDGPVMFDRLPTGEHSAALARRALESSVLVCPGSFFGDPSGVRLCLTRRSFPRDLAAYLDVRDRRSGPRSRTSRSRPSGGRVSRSRPAGTG
jgi:aspartate/methionine/tyrosine aminotransferase